MSESFLTLSVNDRREALEFAASESGRPTHLLEKDVWVVQTLDILFSSEYGPHLVFKGGTALSKVHKVIQRFSEDVDLTYDIRELVPELDQSDIHGMDVIPPNRSQQEKLTKLIRQERLPQWVRDKAGPLVEKALSTLPGVSTRIDDDSVFVDYTSVAPVSNYAPPSVKLEFGGRSTGEPASVYRVECDMAPLVLSLAFPVAEPRAMDITRIFWEKATAVHVYSLQGEQGLAHRFSRHLHDLARLAQAGHLDDAIRARDVSATVAEHKSKFFREKAADGSVIDYQKAVKGSLVLVPQGSALAALREDYQAMVQEGLLLEDMEEFDSLIAHCQEIQTIVNAAIAK